ncbi:MAG TPA: hypothetical protein VJ646_09420 [Candidatus Binatia bacterium]|nr:hypothetical protein [Candidatus Binatia bacterium]
MTSALKEGGLGGIFATHHNHLSDLEINPIMVRAQGGRTAAVDVRMVQRWPARFCQADENEHP